MEEVRCLLLGTRNQNLLRPNGGARVQHPIIEGCPLIESDEESEEEIYEQPLPVANQNNHN